MILTNDKHAPGSALRLDEKSHVEEPLLQQLAGLGWSVLRLEMHGQTPAETGRAHFGEVVLCPRLEAALRTLNPWLEPDQVAEVVRRLTEFPRRNLVENNRQVLAWLLDGIAVAENRATGAKSPTVRLVDFSPGGAARNDWLAVAQLKVRIAGTEHHIVPDVVLFLNGLPIVVIECKSPKVEEPISEAIDQLRRYGELRGATGEGSPELFYYNQFVVATSRLHAKFGTITTHSEKHFYRWTDPWPATLDEVAAKTGTSAGSPSDQARLVAGMGAPENLLSLLRSFTLFATDSRGQAQKIVGRYQQLRAVHKTLDRLERGGNATERSGIVWHTQGSGKSLTMMFLVRELRRRTALADWKIVFVTDRTQLEQQLGETSQSIGQTVATAKNIHHLKELIRDPSSNVVMAMVHKFQERDLQEVFPELNPSPKILVLIDEAHRSQYRMLGANLRRAMRHAAYVAYTGTPIEKTEQTFGDYIDKYTMRQATEDGVTLEIVYEGRTHKAGVPDQAGMDQKFADVFSEQGLAERLEILGFGTRDAYLDSKPTIEAKARDMVGHWLRHVFPNGYKAQVVANSRIAAVRYQTALRDALTAELAELEKANPLSLNLDLLRVVEVGLVISTGHNDEKDIKAAMEGVEADEVVRRFKLPFDVEEGEEGKKLNGRIGLVVVNNMLLTGFDAPIEQVLYLDQVIKNHTLLQTVARVNRVAGDDKEHGLIVDYVGVGHNLKEALDAYAEKEQQEVIECLESDAEVLAELKHAFDETVAVLARHGLTELNEPEAFYDLFYDEEIRFAYLTAFKRLTAAFNAAMPRPEALDHFRVYQRLVAVNELASQFLKDARLSMKGIPSKLRAITDEFLRSEGIFQKIAPISILDAEFEKHVKRRKRSKTKAAEIEHAIRHHIEINLDEDPELYASLAKELERILTEFAGNWDRIYVEMEKLRQKLVSKEKEQAYGLDRKRQLPIFRVVRAELFGEVALSEDNIADLVNLTQQLFVTLQTEVRQAGFWEAIPKQKRLEAELRELLIAEAFVHLPNAFEKRVVVASRLMEWARGNDGLLRRA